MAAPTFRNPAVTVYAQKTFCSCGRVGSYPWLAYRPRAVRLQQLVTCGSANLFPACRSIPVTGCAKLSLQSLAVAPDPTIANRPMERLPCPLRARRY